MATRKVKFDPQELIDEQVNQVDEALAEIERRMAPYAKLNEKKQQLLAARRALLGHGPRLTGGTSTKLHLEDIIEYLKEHPGSAPGTISEHFGVSQTTVSSHFYRNKDRFVSRDGRYYNRDPKAGINTADDIPEEEGE